MKKTEKAVKEAEKIVKQTLLDWGEKNIYIISSKEYKTLIKAGGEKIQEKNNGDGTYYYEISFSNIKFHTCSKNKL